MSTLGLHNSREETQPEEASRQRAPRSGLLGGRHKTNSLADRLAARSVRAASGCLECQGYARRLSGHVQINRGPGLPVASAHQVAWELVNGPIPIGLCVCHHCDNPRCVEPTHLFLGTQAENVHDSIRKGRFNAFGKQVLNAEQVYEIRRLSKAGVPNTKIAARFGVKRNTISGIVHRHSWAHLADLSVSAEADSTVSEQGR